MKTDNKPFLDQDYRVPSKADGYMKLQQGDNRFRIMSQPILGWEWWLDTDDGGRKPIRIPFKQPIPVAHAEDAKHFWAMVVWNYTNKQFQVLEVTQKGIQKTIKNLSQDEDWGSPFNYDIVVTKTGEKMETEYEVKPKPAKELDEEIAAKYKLVNINLDALYEGKDPFSANEVVEDETVQIVEETFADKPKKEEVNEQDLPF